MATLIAIDGLLPLGPNFVQRISESLSKGKNNITNQANFANIQPLLGNQLFGNGNLSMQNIWQNFIEIFENSKQTITQFLNEKGITQERVSQQLTGVVNFSADKVDYVSAYIDITTNYIYHSGSLTVLRAMIERAYGVVQAQPKQPNIAVAHGNIGVARG